MPENLNGGRKMFTQNQLNELRGVDVRTVDRNSLTDMSGFEFDNALPPKERARRFFDATQNPYCFRLDDMAVKIEFAESGQSLQDVMSALLLRQKCGV
jgi:hypothetical protein